MLLSLKIHCLINVRRTRLRRDPDTCPVAQQLYERTSAIITTDLSFCDWSTILGPYLGIALKHIAGQWMPR
ncbi:hypothetical protein RGAI101_2060 [Roseobacter sp. GAI101]|nr:hypothetical protein RGAI101_2060 [Roseobacter sp. GAI101]